MKTGKPTEGYEENDSENIQYNKKKRIYIDHI